MKIHRAVTLLLLILVSVLAIGYSLAIGIQAFDRHSLIALVVVVVAAAIAGLAFSWKRYLPSRRPRA